MAVVQLTGAHTSGRLHEVTGFDPVLTETRPDYRDDVVAPHGHDTTAQLDASESWLQEKLRWAINKLGATALVGEWFNFSASDIADTHLDHRRDMSRQGTFTYTWRGEIKGKPHIPRSVRVVIARHYIAETIKAHIGWPEVGVVSDSTAADQETVSLQSLTLDDYKAATHQPVAATAEEDNELLRSTIADVTQQPVGIRQQRQWDDVFAPFRHKLAAANSRFHRYIYTRRLPGQRDRAAEWHIERHGGDSPVQLIAQVGHERDDALDETLTGTAYNLLLSAMRDRGERLSRVQFDEQDYATRDQIVEVITQHGGDALVSQIAAKTGYNVWPALAVAIQQTRVSEISPARAALSLIQALEQLVGKN